MFNVPADKDDLQAVPKLPPRQSSGRKTAGRRPAKSSAAGPGDWDVHFRNSAIALMLLGIGSFVLPLMGLQFRMFARLGDAAQIGGAIAAVIGAGVFVYAMRHNVAVAGLVSGGAVLLAGVLLVIHLSAEDDGQAPRGGQPRVGENDRGRGGRGPQGRGPRRDENRNAAARTGGSASANGQSDENSKSYSLDLRQGEAEPVDLLGIIHPPRDQILGEWEVQNGHLISPKGRPIRLEVPVIPPESYVLTAVVERIDGRDSINFGLVVGGRGVSVVLDGYGGSTSGLNRLDGKTGDVNETTHRGRVLTDEGTNTIVCTVGPKSVQVECNGTTIIDWQGDPQRLSRDRRWKTGRPDHLMVGCWDTRFRISRLELVPRQAD